MNFIYMSFTYLELFYLFTGLYADKALKVARHELAWECDYIREAKSGERFR
jgi:predicted unusual protein kinase regulating ubiquinone biosynthesis (AarF/ABC1/UbiB family)